MAKARVEMVCPTCGKTYTWTATKYNRREANDWETWASEQERECPDCYKESMRKAREQEEQATVAAAKNNPFGIDVDALDLGGSEKQNDWARKILSAFIVELTAQKPTEKGIEIIGGILRAATARELIDNRLIMTDWLHRKIRAIRNV